MDTSTAKTTATRAWDLRAGDILLPLGLTITHVSIDKTGSSNRMAHLTHDLGVLDVPLNQPVTVQGERPIDLWD